MTVKANQVYSYKGKTVKVGKPQGFVALAREPKGAYRPVRADLLKRTTATLDDFRSRD